MRYISSEFIRRLQDNSTLSAKGSIEFADGTRLTLSGDDFCSVSVEQASSSSGSFDIGAAVIGQLSCTLNNYDDRFSEYDFEGAVISVWVGTTLPSGNEEWVKLGVYHVDRPDSYSGQITVTALDSLSLLEKDYAEGTVTWPCTLQQLADAGCRVCGLINDTAAIPNGSYSVKSAPDLEDASWLDVMGYIAQASGTFVRATADGHVAFSWYDTRYFESEDWLDGQSFDDASPYASGDSADGGTLSDYSSGDSADGGAFANMKAAQINRYSSFTVFTDDVVVTGVSATAQNQVVVGEDGKETNGEDGETALFGSEGYVLSIEDNPLILYGQAATVASQVGARVVGMRFRPFTCDAVVDPSIEAGDAVVVFDRKNNRYMSYVTSTSLSVNGSETIECSAKSTSRNSADKASAATKAVVKARNELKREQTSRELAQADLEKRMEEASGLFTTSVAQADGSSIIYMHDKSDLASSKVVWKFTAEAVAVSTAGPSGPYATGLTADGTALLQRIYAIGIDADYIETGSIKVENKATGERVFEADIDNGTCYVGGSTINIGGSTLNSTVSALEAKYGTCATPAATASKVVTCSGFVLKKGATVSVRFSYANTATTPTLNVNGTGAKVIAYASYASLQEKYWWKGGALLTFAYDGYYWQLTDGSARKDARSIWANDTTAVNVRAGTVTFDANTFVCNATNFKVTSSGTVTANNFSANGTFTGGSTTSGYGMTLGTDGSIRGYRNGELTGRIDPTATVQEVDDNGNYTGTVWYGITVHSNQIIRESSPHISTLASADSSNVSTRATTGQNMVITGMWDNGDGSVGWSYQTWKFINGRLVTAL